jgi:hypothetical protein
MATNFKISDSVNKFLGDIFLNMSVKVKIKLALYLTN